MKHAHNAVNGLVIHRQAGGIRALIFLLKPINFLFAQLKKGLRRLVRSSPQHSVTDSELLTLVEEAEAMLTRLLPTKMVESSSS